MLGDVSIEDREQVMQLRDIQTGRAAMGWGDESMRCMQHLGGLRELGDRETLCKDRVFS